jgi:hypothetical protein
MQQPKRKRAQNQPKVPIAARSVTWAAGNYCRLTCAGHHLCWAPPVLGTTCAGHHLCGAPPVRGTTCAGHHLCGAPPVLGTTCAGHHLCWAPPVLGTTAIPGLTQANEYLHQHVTKSAILLLFNQI